MDGPFKLAPGIFCGCGTFIAFRLLVGAGHLPIASPAAGPKRAALTRPCHFPLPFAVFSLM
jgi:hypothetical protein